MMNSMAASLRTILNTFYSGPQAWFFLAADRGYFDEAGLTLDFVEGDTAANVVPKVASGAFDVGYGDLNALIEWAGENPRSVDAEPHAPVGVFATFNASPYTIVVPARGPIQTPAQLMGTTLAAHPNDAAMKMFPALAGRAGIDVQRVDIAISSIAHPTMLRKLLEENQWDGVFGFVNTLRAAAIEARIDPTRLRFLEYREHVPELYGAALLVARRLIDAHPEIVSGLVRAVNRGLHDTIADVDAAIEAVARRNPAIDRAANRARLVGTLGLEMSHPEGAHLGIGAIDATRFNRAIDTITASLALPRRPALPALFDSRFLPSFEQRVRSLAQSM